MIPDILETLWELNVYYTFSRGAGHTTAMLKGAENTDCLVLFANYSSAREVEHRVGKKLWTSVTLSGLRWGLRGIRKPMLIDHYALQTILRDAVVEIVHLRSELEKARR